MLQYMWVMPSSSARCAQLPRAADKVPFYAALKKFRDYLNGLVPELDEKEIVFSYSKLKNFFEPEVKEEKDGQLCSYGYNGRTGDGLQDMTASVIKKEPGDDSGGPPKKKRGRPKKIKVEGEAPPEKKEKPPKEIYDKDGNPLPKKKRGRPKKIKPEPTSSNTSEQKPMPQQTPPQQPSSQTTSQAQSSTTNTPATTSQTSQPSTPNCFSPPIQSPINLCQQQNFPQMYNNQPHSFSGNSSRSPLSNQTFHQSPMQSNNYNQSPQPAAPFSHSELSSDMNAPGTSEPNLAARSPSTSSVGPQEFESTAAVQEDNSKSSSDIKEETTDTHMECHFSSPAPSKKKSPEMNYQNYDEYSGDSETSPSVRYPQRPPSGFAPKPAVNSQDVATKSLSGLESLVDQIPNIGDGETPHTVVSGEALESASSTVSGGQYSDDSAYLSDYPRVSHYSPQYPSTVPTTSSNSNTYTSPSPSMNFSVTSLANSSATSSNETSGSFSVTSLASNYNSSHTVTSSYPNLMGPPHPMGSHHVIESFGGGLVDRRIGSPMEPLANMSGVNMPGSPLPYPYNQYSGPYPGGPPAGFPYSPSHNIHVPSPNFPYPSPYSNSGYPQSSYLQSHVFDRLKNEGRMDIGYGGGF